MKLYSFFRSGTSHRLRIALQRAAVVWASRWLANAV